MIGTVPTLAVPTLAVPAVAVPASTVVPGPVLDDGGLVLGVDDAGRPVRLHLFRERVCAVTALLPVDLVAVLAFRAVATGARLCVVTDKPSAWEAARALSGVGEEQVSVLPPLSRPDEEASFARPLLVVREGDQLPGVFRLRPGPWRAGITAVSRFGPHAVAVARSSQVTLFGRLDAGIAQSAARALNLAPEAATVLAGLAGTELAVLAGDDLRVIDLAPTPFEQQLRAGGAP